MIKIYIDKVRYKNFVKTGETEQFINLVLNNFLVFCDFIE